MVKRAMKPIDIVMMLSFLFTTQLMRIIAVNYIMTIGFIIALFVFYNTYLYKRFIPIKLRGKKKAAALIILNVPFIVGIVGMVIMELNK